jgi:hypothetical protein
MGFRLAEIRPQAELVETSWVLLVPNTSGPRDVPRWGGSEFTSKDATIQGEGSSRNRH